MNIKRAVRRSLANIEKDQKWLAGELGTTEAQISRWVNADHLNTKIIERLANLFGLTVSEFIALGE